MKSASGLLLILALGGGALLLLDRPSDLQPGGQTGPSRAANPFETANPLKGLNPPGDTKRVKKAAITAPASPPGPVTRLYRWRDERGNWHISDHPPEGDVEYLARDYPHNLNRLPAVVTEPPARPEAVITPDETLAEAAEVPAEDAAEANEAAAPETESAEPVADGQETADASDASETGAEP